MAKGYRIHGDMGYKGFTNEPEDCIKIMTEREEALEQAAEVLLAISNGFYDSLGDIVFKNKGLISVLSDMLQSRA